MKLPKKSVLLPAIVLGGGAVGLALRLWQLRGGMDPEGALACITINAAQLAGIDDRVGSLTPGKDADVVVTSAHPLNWLSRVRLVVMDGKVIKE